MTFIFINTDACTYVLPACQVTLQKIVSILRYLTAPGKNSAVDYRKLNYWLKAEQISMKVADSLNRSGKIQSIDTTLVLQTEHWLRQRADSPKILLPQWGWGSECSLYTICCCKTRQLNNWWKPKIRSLLLQGDLIYTDEAESQEKS